MDNCIFCKIAKAEIPSQKVFEDEHVFAFKDISPRAPTHILVVPKRHIEKFADLTDADEQLMGHLMLSVRKIAALLGVDESGFRIVINNGESAGQSVWHLHLHLMSGRSFQWPPG